MALAITCWWVSRYIPATGSAVPDLKIDANILRLTWRIVDELRQEKRIWITGLMVSWFWLIGAIILSFLPPMVTEVLGGSEIIVTRYLAIFAVALGVGSAVAAWMSAGRVVLLPAPVGTGRSAGVFLSFTVTLPNHSRAGLWLKRHHHFWYRYVFERLCPHGAPV